MMAFDLPGHARSADWDDTRDYSQLSAEIAESFCEQPMELIGHSFGATVALRLAATRPDLVTRLTLIEPVFFAAAIARGGQVVEDHERLFAPFVKAIEAGDRTAAAHVFTDIWGTGQRWEDIPQRQRDYLADRIHLIPAQTAGIYDDNAGLLRTGALEKICCQVLLVEGGKSPAIIGAILNALEPRFENVRRIDVAGAGHMVPITHPLAVAAAIQDV